MRKIKDIEADLRVTKASFKAAMGYATDPLNLARLRRTSQINANKLLSVIERLENELVDTREARAARVKPGVPIGEEVGAKSNQGVYDAPNAPAPTDEGLRNVPVYGYRGVISDEEAVMAQAREEIEHEINPKLIAIAEEHIDVNTPICPDCNGEGRTSYMDGSDGGDCVLCAGRGFLPVYNININEGENDHDAIPEAAVLDSEPSSASSQGVETPTGQAPVPAPGILTPEQLELANHFLFPGAAKNVAELSHPGFARGGFIPAPPSKEKRMTEHTAELVALGEEPPAFVRKTIDPTTRKKRDPKYDKFVQVAFDNPDVWGRLVGVELKSAATKNSLEKQYKDETDEDGRRLQVVARRLPHDENLYGFWIRFAVPEPVLLDAEGGAPEVEPED